MNVTCKDRDRIFEDGAPAEWAALEAHAATCASCAEELRAWKSLSIAAADLRDYADTPTLWPRIRRSLAEEAARAPQPRAPGNWRFLFPNFAFQWQTAAAACAKRKSPPVKKTLTPLLCPSRVRPARIPLFA